MKYLVDANVVSEPTKPEPDLAVVDWLRNRNYSGWALVEQDVLPGMGAPRESASRNRQYLKSIGV